MFLKISSLIGGVSNYAKLVTWIKNLIEKIKYKNLPYYFDEYKKHVTIYENGNGIVINTFTVIVNDVNKFSKIKRCINIEDGKSDNKFPSLKEMLKTDIKDRFDKFGFWYYSDNNIISDAYEFYWTDVDDTIENKRLKGNKKELRWIFNINQSKIDVRKKYKIIYILSIPGMYPLEQGCFNRLISNDFTVVDYASSSMNVLHMLKKVTYIISFENRIELECEPSCEVLKNKQDNIDKMSNQCDHDNNIIYNRYIFKTVCPAINSNIIIKWKFKDINQQEDSFMDKESGD